MCCNDKRHVRRIDQAVAIEVVTVREPGGIERAVGVVSGGQGVGDVHQGVAALSPVSPTALPQ